MSNAIGLSFFWLFGLFWVFFPKPVVRFYKWFHSGSSLVQQLQPRHARNAGLLWLMVMTVVTYATWRQ